MRGDPRTAFFFNHTLVIFRRFIRLGRMKRLGATLFAGAIFLLAAFFAGLLPVSFAGVSPETELVKHARETWSVKQGVSRDGLLVVTRAPAPPAVPPREKSMNHSRTLRAFIAPNRAGLASLYVESVHPHEYYSVSGGFTLLRDYMVPVWLSEDALMFYGTSPEGQLMRYTVLLGDLTLSGVLSADAAPPLSLPVPTAVVLP